MAINVKQVTLWRKEVDNRAGVLASTLEPIARAGVDLQVVMGYRYPGNETKAAIEVYPVTGKKAASAAQAANLTASSIPTLHVEGDNRPGLGYAIARALADGGINISFEVAQVIGRRFSAIFGFETDDQAKKAATVIKKAVAAKSKARARG
jgi:hypothetical protein